MRFKMNIDEARNLVLKCIVDFSPAKDSRVVNAKKAAEELFSYVLYCVEGEIVRMYVLKCKEEFFQKFTYDEQEPYFRGFNDVRYFLIRSFNISYETFYKSIRSIRVKFLVNVGIHHVFFICFLHRA